MSGEFVAEYVQECIKDGIQRPADIRRRAELEISGINDEIQKIESLRVRQGNLRAVIRHMGGGGVKLKKPVTKTMDFTMSWEELEDSFKKICLSICNLIQEEGRKMPGEIMDALSREQRAVYSAIKWLEYNEVIARQDTDEGRAVIKGNAWQPFMDKVKMSIANVIAASVWK